MCVHTDAQQYGARHRGPHLCSLITSHYYSETSRPREILPFQQRRRAGPRPLTTSHRWQTKTHPAPAGSRGRAAPSRVTADAAPACLTGPTWLHGITAEDGLQDKRSEARLDSGRVRYRCCVTPVPAHGRAAVRQSPRDDVPRWKRPQPGLALLVLVPVHLASVHGLGPRHLTGCSPPTSSRLEENPNNAIFSCC